MYLARDRGSSERAEEVFGFTNRQAKTLDKQTVMETTSNWRERKKLKKRIEGNQISED